MRGVLRAGLGLLVGALVAAGCGAMDMESGGAWGGDTTGADAAGGGGWWDGAAYEDVPWGPGADTAAAGDAARRDVPWQGRDAGPRPDLPPPPPEEEQDFGAPSAGDRFVFVLHPSREQLIVVDGVTLDIDLVTVGLRPTALATARGHDVAVVINAGGGDLSVVHAGPEGTTARTVPTVEGVNRVVVAPDGRHAVAYFSYEALTPGEPVGSLQSVTLVRLDPDAVASIEVGTGFHPISVTFSADGAAAFVVSEEGVTRIPLTTPDLGRVRVLPTTPVSADPLEQALEREVLVTPDGAFAVVRALGLARLSVVDLASGAITRFPLPGEPTDLDLTGDGQRLLVVMRRERLALVGTLAALMAEPRAAGALREVSLGDLPMGAAVIDPAGARALLYTTVDDTEALLRLDLASGTTRPILLQKTVRAVAFDPTGRRALVLHRTSGAVPSASLPLDQFVDASQGYSVVDVAGGVARLELTTAAPGAFAFTPGGERLYVLLPDPGLVTHAVADVNLATLMGVQRPLASPPETVQAVPAAGKVAVSQAHPTGRLTFFDVATGDSDTLTGFQLGGLIQ
jgi:DNA-binding beta-propeller fold protein YncE